MFIHVAVFDTILLQTNAHNGNDILCHYSIVCYWPNLSIKNGNDDDDDDDNDDDNNDNNDDELFLIRFFCQIIKS